jgi:hypothetical protein
MSNTSFQLATGVSRWMVKTATNMISTTAVTAASSIPTRRAAELTGTIAATTASLHDGAVHHDARGGAPLAGSDPAERLTPGAMSSCPSLSTR